MPKTPQDRTERAAKLVLFFFLSIFVLAVGGLAGIALSLWVFGR